MITLEARPAPSRAMSVASPVLALAITVAIGVALFALLGKDPLRGLQMFFVEPVKDLRALSELSVKATPLVLIALGLAVCFRANVWNIGAEGQYIAGALAAGWVAMQAGPGTPRAIVVAIALAGVAAETGVVMLIYLDPAWREAQVRCASRGTAPGASDLYAAVMEGAVERVRPKMMTVVAIMAGLLPIMWGTGTGSEVMSRIAAPMVGGMISSTVLTLAVIPAIYALVKEWQLRRADRQEAASARALPAAQTGT